MKRNEIRTKIRYNIRETTAQVWAEAELNYWINDVQKEVAAVLDPAYSPKLTQIKTQVVTTGSAFYDLPIDFLKILGNADLDSVVYVYVPPGLVRPQLLDKYSYNSDKKIFYIRDNDIYLHPVPTASENGEGLFYEYLSKPPDLADDTTTDGYLTEVAYNLVVDKVSGLALMKIDSEEAHALSKRFFDKYEADLKRLNEAMR